MICSEPHFISQETLRDYLNQNPNTYDRIKYLTASEIHHEQHIVIIKNDIVVAMAGLQNSPYEKDIIWIKFISVDPNYQGMGLSRKILEFMYEWASTNHIKLKSSDFSDQGEARLKHIHEQLNNRYLDVHEF